MSTTPLRIALISETFPPEINGVANTLGRLAAGLLQLGHRVQVVRPRQHVDDGRHSDDELLLTRGWPLPGYPGLQWGQSCLHKLLRHWRRLRPDVLYIATEGPLGLAALRAARRLRIPALSGFHTNFQQYSAHYGLGPLTRLVTAYLRWFHNRTQRTLVPSASQALELERRGFAHLAQLARGVDGQLFQPGRRDDALRREWGLGEQDIAVLISAHDMNPLMKETDRIVYVAAGRAAAGPTDEVIRADVLSTLYGSPVEVLRVRGRVIVVSGEERHNERLDGDPVHHLDETGIVASPAGRLDTGRAGG